MKKELLKSALDRIAQEVPELRWIDTDEGQLDFADSRPPVAFPCCLADLTLPDCDNMANNGPLIQIIRVRLTLKVAFNDCASFNTKTPVSVREKAFSRLDVLQSIHKALQAWRTENCMKSFRRLSVTTQPRPDGLKAYACIYEATYIDQPE